MINIVISYILTFIIYSGIVIVLESFSRCTMRKELNNYVASRIGTIDGEYSLKSEYIMLEMNEEASEDSFPCGFEGYDLPDFNSNNKIISSNST